MNFKRLLSVIVALAMMFSLLIPAAVSSEETDEVPATAEVVNVTDNTSEEPDEPEAAEDNKAEDPADETPADETPTDETPADETPTDETPADETPVDETPADEAPADETPADETSTDETPADETPADEILVDEEPADETPAEEDGTVDNEVLDDEPVTENTDSEDAEEEELPFAQGYVRVNDGTIVYASESKQEKKGSFSGDAIVYATMSTRAENEAYSWLQIVFDTAEAREAGEALLSGYVQFKEVTVLSDEASEQLAETLGNDNTARKYGEILLPVVTFVLNAEESNEEDNAEIDELETDEIETNADPAVVITDQAHDINARSGEQVNLYVTATGSGLSYQWQYKLKATSTVWQTPTSAGSKTASWKFTMMSSIAGRVYRCVVTDANGQTATSENILLTLNTAPVGPVITGQAHDINARSGEQVNLYVTATGSGLSYQWQYKLTATSTVWQTPTSAGSKTASWKFNMVSSIAGRVYRCVVTDANGQTATSENVLLTLNTSPAGPKITDQAHDINARSGDQVNLYVTATGSGLSYQWQYKLTATSTVWKTPTSAGSKTASWKFTMISSIAGRVYRCVVTDANGQTATSENILLTLNTMPAGPKITDQTHDVEARTGEQVNLYVIATGSGLSYQWQYKISAASTSWLTPTGAESKEASWKFNMTADIAGYVYRCVVTDANGQTATSENILLTLNTSPVGPKITDQAHDINARSGEQVNLYVTATGSGLSYQWQYKLTATSTVWKTPTSAGSKTASWKFTMMSSIAGRVYRCIVTDANGQTATSENILLTLITTPAGPVITDQVHDIEARAGEQVNLYVTATGSGLSYQWQYKLTAASTSWVTPTDAESKTASWKFNMTADAAGRVYRCIVSDTYGQNATSENILLTLITTPAGPEITDQAHDIEARAGQQVNLYVTATGSGLSYQWQYKLTATSTVWRTPTSAGSKTASWKFAMTSGIAGRVYRCVVTDANGQTATSEEILLTLSTVFVVDDVTYEALTSTTCKVVSYSGTASSLTIPATVEGMRVTEIGEEAFMGNTTLTSISLPNTITAIRARAFKNCTNLSSMTTH